MEKTDTSPHFCVECGTKLDSIMKFCPHCGVKIERSPESVLPSADTIIAPNNKEESSTGQLDSSCAPKSSECIPIIMDDVPSELPPCKDDIDNELNATETTPEITGDISPSEADPHSSSNRDFTDSTNDSLSTTESTTNTGIKSIIITTWNHLSGFLKIWTITAIICFILLIIAICIKKAFPIVFSVLQLSSLTSALLVHKGIIQKEKNWLKICMLCLSVLLIGINIWSYSWFNRVAPTHNNTPSSNTSTSNHVGSSSGVNSTPSHSTNNKQVQQPVMVAIPCNPDDLIGKDYSEVEAMFKSAGFKKISKESRSDLDVTNLEMTDVVVLVSINDSADYSLGDQIEDNSAITIYCHGPKYLELPFTLEEAKNTETEEVSQSLIDAGFENVSISEIADLDPDKSNSAFCNEISIDGTPVDSNGMEYSILSEILIIRHITYEKYDVTIDIEFISNLFLDKYDVTLYVNSDEVGTILHGEDIQYRLRLQSGNYDLVFKANGSIKNGKASLAVTSKTEVEYKIKTNSSEVVVSEIRLLHDGEVRTPASADSFKSSYKYDSYSEVKEELENAGFTNITLEPVYDSSSSSTNINKVIEVRINEKTAFKQDEVFSADIPVTIKYHEDSSKDPVAIAAAKKATELEKIFPKEMAKRAVVVAMTNCQATDVYQSDGNTLDVSKFHAYKDIGDFFMTIETEGTWTVLDGDIWHVEGIVLRIYGYDTYLKASGSIKKDGDSYVFFNVDRSITTKEYINSTDTSKNYVEHFEPSDSNPYLTVPSSLLNESRDEAAANEKMTYKEKRQKWIESQFHWWDGRHTELSDLIKEQLNDSKSFKHKDAKYIDVCDEASQNVVNTLLKSAGYSERVEIGDLFVQEVFTAKNGYNATITATGYGIVRSSGKVILLSIE